MCLYGDPAYPLRVNLLGSFRNVLITPQMQQSNKTMSTVRDSVEWMFGDIIGSFKFLDLKKNQKIGLSAIGKQYIVSFLVRNAIACIYGNTTSVFFDINPLSLEEYFN